MRAALGPWPNPIEWENALPGSPGFPIDNFAAAREIEGYAEATSVEAGATLGIHASSQTDTMLSWEVWRLGYYGGVLARRLADGGPISVLARPLPVWSSSTGRLECSWPETFRIDIDAHWPTGLYVVKLLVPSGTAAFVPFAVRETGRRAPALVLQSTNTYQAYNSWGGDSLYVNATGFPHERAYEVSYDRPYADGYGASDLWSRDRYLVAFLEAQGYDLAYATDVDLAQDPSLLDGRMLLVVAGHAEYWSAAERDPVEEAVASGLSIASLAGNESFWQVRLEPSTAGTPARVIVCYKDDAPFADPLYASDPASATMRWRDVGRPENQLFGVMYGSYQLGFGPLVIEDAPDWLLDGTGLLSGDLVPGVFGYESDRVYMMPAPPPGLVIGGSSLVVDLDNGHFSAANVGLYETEAAGFVFSGGSIDWSAQLARPGVWDPRIQQMTANLLARGLSLPSAPVRPLAIAPGAAPPRYAPGPRLTTIISGSELGVPVGIAARADGQLYVTDEAGGRLLVVDPQGQMITTLAQGLSAPRGVAVDTSGNAWVVESGAGRLTRVTPGGVSTVLASGMSRPVGVAVGVGRVFVTDPVSRRLRAFGVDGSVLADPIGGLVQPSAITIGPDGAAYVLDNALAQVLRVAAGSATPLAGLAHQFGANDGPLDSATLGGGEGILVRSDGSTLLSDARAARIRRVRRGAIETLVGGVSGRWADGAGPDAGLLAPAGMTLLSDGSVMIVDAGHAALRRLTE